MLEAERSGGGGEPGEARGGDEDRRATFAAERHVDDRVDDELHSPYADLGPLHDFAPRDEQSQKLYAVMDRSTASFDIDFGIGHGFTEASNDWTAKYILSWSF